jgi:hypothetical protein
MQDMRCVSLPCGPKGETSITFMIPNFGTVAPPSSPRAPGGLKLTDVWLIADR